MVPVYAASRSKYISLHTVPLQRRANIVW